jgi:hypothetical protein
VTGGCIGWPLRRVGKVTTLLLPGIFIACSTAARPADYGELARKARDEKAIASLRVGDDANAVRQQLLDATLRLDRYLTSGGATGNAWKRYLRFDELVTSLKAGSVPSDKTLTGVLRRLRADYAGLELPIFQSVAHALEDYIPLVRQQCQPSSQLDIEQNLEQLATHLEALPDPPTSDDVAEITRILGWLSERGLSAGLVMAVHNRLSQTNLQVQVSEGLIGKGSLREIRDRTMPVRDVILGTSIVGSGRTTGWVRTRLLSDANRALFETTLEATNYAQTIGCNGPARIGSNSTTQLKGIKSFYVDGTGFHVWAARSSADARSQIYGIWSNKHGLMDRVVRKVATKRVGQQKRQAERIASRHAELQLNARLNTEANAQLGRAHADFTNKLRNPLVRLAQWPRDLRISTTDSQFRLSALHDSPSRLGAPIAPPKVPENVALVVQVHESLVNNYGDGLLAGQTVKQQQLDRLSMDLFGRRPPQLAHDEEKGPWAITFNSHEPILLHIDGGKASLTIRGRRFKSEVRTIDTPLDVTAHYRLLRQDNAAKAVREGELEVLPAGFVPGGDRKMNLRESRDANFVRHRFDDFFTPEITSQGLILPGQWARVGRLDLVELHADHGWVTLAWKMKDEG